MRHAQFVVQPDGSLSNMDPWIDYQPGETDIVLDGRFELDVLRALVAYMERSDAAS